MQDKRGLVGGVGDGHVVGGSGGGASRRFAWGGEVDQRCGRVRFPGRH